MRPNCWSGSSKRTLLPVRPSMRSQVGLAVKAYHSQTGYPETYAQVRRGNKPKPLMIVGMKALWIVARQSRVSKTEATCNHETEAKSKNRTTGPIECDIFRGTGGASEAQMILGAVSGKVDSPVGRPGGGGRVREGRRERKGARRGSCSGAPAATMIKGERQSMILLTNTEGNPTAFPL